MWLVHKATEWEILSVSKDSSDVLEIQTRAYELFLAFLVSKAYIHLDEAVQLMGAFSDQEAPEGKSPWRRYGALSSGQVQVARYIRGNYESSLHR